MDIADYIYNMENRDFDELQKIVLLKPMNAELKNRLYRIKQILNDLKITSIETCSECGTKIEGEPIIKHWDDDPETVNEYYCKECGKELAPEKVTK